MNLGNYFLAVALLISLPSLLLSQKKTFPCDGKLLLTQADRSSGVSDIYKIEKEGSSVNFQLLKNYNNSDFNAVGFNRQDNFIYGINKFEEILRIFADGTFKKLGSITTSFDYLTAGDFGPDGNYYAGRGSILYRIQIDGNQAQKKETYNFRYKNRNGSPSFADVVFEPGTSTAYGYDRSTGKLAKINLATEEAELFNRSYNFPNMGAIFFDAKKNLYGYNNDNLYQINYNKGVIQKIANGPSSTDRDGCSCPYSMDVIQQFAPAKPCPGDTVTMTVTLFNNTDSVVQGVSYKNNLKQNAKFVSNPSSTFSGNIQNQTGKGEEDLILTNMTLQKGVSKFRIDIQLPSNQNFKDFANQGLITQLPQYLTDTIYSDDTATFKGDDSTIISYKDKTTKTITKHICKGDSYNFAGRTLTSAGTYQDTLYPAKGCAKQLTTLNLKTHKEQHDTVIKKICEGNNTRYGGRQFLDTGTYSVSLNSQYGCDSTIQLNLGYFKAKSITIDTTICKRDTLTFGSEKYHDTGSYTIYLEAEGANDCDTVIDLAISHYPDRTKNVDTGICENDTLSFYEKQIAKPGSYSFRKSNGFNCDSTINLQLDQYPVKTKSLDRTFCKGDSIRYNDQVIKEAGTHQYAFKTSKGCDSNVSLKAETKPNPKPGLPPDTTFCEFNDTKLSTRDFEKIIWQNGFTGQNVSVEKPGKYKVTVTAENNCSANDSTQVIQECPTNLYFPTGFTPNGDGINDEFSPRGNNIKNYRLKIYNRWGEQIFETKNLDESWDATYKNKRVPTGIYLYLVSYKATLPSGAEIQKERSGKVKVIR